MKCQYHPDQESTNTCAVCSRALCPSCAHSIKGKILCQDCLVAGSELAAIAGSQQMQNYSPSRAACFAIIPGMGAVYNQQYVKAVQHLAVFAALWIMADVAHEIFGLLAVSFYVFTIVDAYRSAHSMIRRRMSGLGDVEEPAGLNIPLGGGALVLMGLLFFLDNMRMFRLRDIIEYVWPFVFVIVGAYLIYDFYKKPTPSQMETTTGSAGSSLSSLRPEAPIPGQTPPEAPGAVSETEEQL